LTCVKLKNKFTSRVATAMFTTPAEKLHPPPDRRDRSSIHKTRVEGKFFFRGETKFLLAGVTYGPFGSEGEGEYLDPKKVEQDFSRIAASGINSVRLYTVPPRWLLDAAQRHHLWVMVGLPWEQHVAFLENRKRPRLIARRVREGVRVCAGHPAVLAYAIGNEIPAGVVRWHGREAVEQFLETLCRIVRKVDPGALTTYVNYPTTEYLRLSFVDFLCFNVFLESQESFDAYVARLQNIAGERPLVLSEIGLDSRRHGQDRQAEMVSNQITTAFAAGCAGAFVFSYTDEWHRGGYPIEDWDFGLTDRQRRPKPALAAAASAFSEIPFRQSERWPRISVAVCSYDGEKTLGECLSKIEQLDYPDYEVIVVNDGSNDATATVASRYQVRLVNTKNGGLSAARNVAMDAATGEIIAYIDDDAYPDRDWLKYLAFAFRNGDCAAVGGPNLLPPHSSLLARCVAHSPGGPSHVLISDRVAEHLPGCNMAVRLDRLTEIGGFDARFRVAGDDVDACWRLQEKGGTLGFAPSAVVWHHRRGSLASYWKQQFHYGIAEALLERKWPEKYNIAGHLTWAGRLYGSGAAGILGLRERIYHGTWGSAPFQSAEIFQSDWASLPLTPEYYLLIAGLAAASLLGLIFTPLLLLLLPLALAIALPIWTAVKRASAIPSKPKFSRRWRTMVGFFHLLQPLARLCGRFAGGLHPWRNWRASGFAFPRLRGFTIWSKMGTSSQERLAALESTLHAHGYMLRRGREFDRWDLDLRIGFFGGAKLWILAEEHGEGKQLIRLRLRPTCKSSGLIILAGLSGDALLASFDELWLPAAIVGTIAIVLALETLRECGAAIAAFLSALGAEGKAALKLEVNRSKHDQPERKEVAFADFNER
jgi:O-antigen biosynthesis protein